MFSPTVAQMNRVDNALLKYRARVRVASKKLYASTGFKGRSNWISLDRLEEALETFDYTQRLARCALKNKIEKVVCCPVDLCVFPNEDIHRDKCLQNGYAHIWEKCDWDAVRDSNLLVEQGLINGVIQDVPKKGDFQEQYLMESYCVDFTHNEQEELTNFLLGNANGAVVFQHIGAMLNQVDLFYGDIRKMIFEDWRFVESARFELNMDGHEGEFYERQSVNVFDPKTKLVGFVGNEFIRPMLKAKLDILDRCLDTPTYNFDANGFIPDEDAATKDGGYSTVSSQEDDSVDRFGCDDQMGE